MGRLRNRAYHLLRKSESFFKTDMVYLVKNGSWLGGGQVAMTLLAFVASLFFANLLPKEIYGNYKFVLTATSILASFSLSGMGSVVTQGVAKRSEGILKDAVSTMLRWGGIITVIGFGMAIYYFKEHNLVLATSMLIAGISLPLMNAYGLFSSYQTGKKDFRGFTIYSVGSQTFTTTALILTALATQNVIMLVVAYFATNVIADIWSYRHLLSTSHINEERDHSLIPYSKHLSVANLFNTIANQLDKVLVFHYLGAAELAIYAFAQAIPDQIKGAFKSVFGIALPKYASMSEKEMRDSIRQKAITLTIVTTAVVLAYVLAAPYIFEWLFPKYLSSIGYSQIYMLGFISVPSTALFSTYFQVTKSLRAVYRINLIGNTTTVILTFFFISMFGLMGAVIENGISWLVICLSSWYYFAKTTDLKVKSY